MEGDCFPRLRPAHADAAQGRRRLSNPFLFLEQRGHGLSIQLTDDLEIGGAVVRNLVRNGPVGDDVAANLDAFDGDDLNR